MISMRCWIASCSLVFDWVEADRGCVMLRDPRERRTLQPAARCDRAGSRSAATKDRRDFHQSTRFSTTSWSTRKVSAQATLGDDSQIRCGCVSIVQAGVREALCVPLARSFTTLWVLCTLTPTPPPGELSCVKENKQRFTDDHLRLDHGDRSPGRAGDRGHLLLQGTSCKVSDSPRWGRPSLHLSHHVKNILQGIRGGSYLIEAGLERNDTDLRCVEVGESSTSNQDRISNLVMDMLTFSKGKGTREDPG